MIPPGESPAFIKQSETFTFAGILFDMDGTIVDSTDAIIKHWHKSVSPMKRSRKFQLVAHVV